MRPVLFILILAFIWGSCTLDEDYHFDSDWAGRYESTFDISLLVGPSNDSLETKEPISQSKVDDLISEINSTPGISEASVIEDLKRSTLTFSYSFQNLQALNELNAKELLSTKDSPVGSIGRWKMKAKGSKRFIMTMNPYKEEDVHNLKEAENIGDLLDISITLNFFKPIKKLKSELAILGENNNQIIITYTLADLWKEDKNWDVSVKF